MLVSPTLTHMLRLPSSSPAAQIELETGGENGGGEAFDPSSVDHAILSEGYPGIEKIKGGECWTDSSELAAKKAEDGTEARRKAAGYTFDQASLRRVGLWIATARITQSPRNIKVSATTVKKARLNHGPATTALLYPPFGRLPASHLCGGRVARSGRVSYVSDRHHLDFVMLTVNDYCLPRIRMPQRRDG